MEFESQVCTTKEQSEKLLSLGLKMETADMTYLKDEICAASYNEMECPYDNLVKPAWSLHRLMCLCPVKLGPDDGGERASWDMYAPDEYELQVSHDFAQYLDDGARYGGERLGCFWGEGNAYNAIIKCIEWLIKDGHFSKEYLEE